MLKHSICGYNLYLDLTKSLRFLVVPAIGGSGLKPGGGNISFRDGSQDVIFFCPRCNKNVDESEIVSQCMQCGEKIPVTGKIYRLHSSGGIFCEKCCNEYFPENRKELLKKIINTVLLG